MLCVTVDGHVANSMRGVCIAATVEARRVNRRKYGQHSSIADELSQEQVVNIDEPWRNFLRPKIETQFHTIPEK